jgi:hypothetical protein
MRHQSSLLPLREIKNDPLFNKAASIFKFRLCGSYGDLMMNWGGVGWGGVGWGGVTLPSDS